MTLPSTTAQALALLQERRISTDTIAAFRIEPNGNGWQYPIPGSPEPVHKKYYDSSHEPKYIWPNGQPDGARYYHCGSADDLRAAIRAASGVIWLASGIPDVWALHAAGIANALCWFNGEASVPATLAADLIALGAVEARYTPDRDKTGKEAAVKVRAALAGKPVDLRLYELPYPLGSKGDVGRFWKEFTGSDFAAALAALPPLDLPAIYPAEPERRSTPYTGPDTPEYERWCIEYVEAAAVMTWGIADDTNRRGFSKKRFYVPSQHRDDGQKPAGSWNYHNHGFYDFGIGEHVATPQVAELLGLLPFGEWIERQRPAASPASESTGVESTRFDHGLPYTLNKRLLNAHFKTDTRNQGPAALVWFVYQEIADDLPDSFTAGEYQKASKAAGRNLTRHTVEAGLAQLAAWGVGEFCEKCTLPYSNQNIDRVQNSHNSDRNVSAGRPGRVFRFYPIGQQVENFARHYAYLIREEAYQGAPDDVQPEWFDDTDSDLIALLDEIRALVYRQHAAARQRAQEATAQQTAWLQEAADHARRGRYQVVDLPPGELRNARDYRAALHRATLERSGGERDDGYKQQFEIGVSRSTLGRIRDQNQVITVERTARVLAADVSDYQRDHGLVLTWHDDDTATVRQPAAEKLLDLADDGERAAFQEKQEKQRQRAARASIRRAKLQKSRQAQPPASQKPQERPPAPLCIPDSYSDRHVWRQLADYTPGADQVRQVVFDFETGEVLQNLTRSEYARALVAQSARGEKMTYDPLRMDEVEPEEVRPAPVTARPDKLCPQNVEAPNSGPGKVVTEKKAERTANGRPQVETRPKLDGIKKAGPTITIHDKPLTLGAAG